MNVPLHRGQQHFAARGAAGLLHVRLELADCSLHHLGALQDLGDDELVVVEQTPDFGHAGHQGSVDDVQRLGPTLVGERLLDVLAETLLAAFDDRPRQALLERTILPRGRFDRRLAATKMGRELLDRRIAAGHVVGCEKEQLLGQLALCGRNLSVASQAFGVDDGGAQTGLCAVIKKDRVQNLTPRRRQAEADVRDTEEGAAVGHRLAQPADRLHRCAG